jgi:hypothetical protein
MKTSPWRFVAFLGLTAVLAGIFVLILQSGGVEQRDFISYWAAGRQIVSGADPYDGAAIRVMEHAAGYDQSYHLIMRNPPVALFLVVPLGFVAPKTGLLFWMIGLSACLVASIRILWIMHGRPTDRLHLLGYCFAPVIAGLMAGQLGIFLLLGVVIFLYFHKSRPALAGAALLLCAAKPHLLLPFGIVLLLWVFVQKAYRILAGFSAALLTSCTLTLCFDPHAWPQYFRGMRTAGIMDEFIPTMSGFLRLVLHRDAVWLQFVPEVLACLWALWYFWARRNRWNWMDQGLLLLLVSVLCAPYAWFTDEAILLPAVLAGIYRADETGRSLLPFGFIAGIAMIEVFAKIPLTTIFYLWTVPAWLAWYVYATWDTGMQGIRTQSQAAQI